MPRSSSSPVIFFLVFSFLIYNPFLLLLFLFEVSPLLIVCPIQFHCLVLIIVNRDLSSSTSFNTSFDMCSVQLIFSILRHTFISKASNLVMSSFLIVLISAQYTVTLQISVFTILFLRHLHSSHSFIHSGHFYSAPSSPLLLRRAPDYSPDTVSEFHVEAHRQLRVKDLPKVPTWRLERESNSRPPVESNRLNQCATMSNRYTYTYGFLIACRCSRPDNPPAAGGGWEEVHGRRRHLSSLYYHLRWHLPPSEHGTTT